MPSASLATRWPRLDAWHLNGLGVVLLLALAVTLVVLHGRLRRRRWWCVTAASVTLALLLASDVQSLAMVSYRCHMIEHLIVLGVVAPLLAGANARPMPRSVATLGFLALTFLIPLYHLSALGGFVMRYGGAHDLELVAFLLIGVWFWTPVYGAHQLLTARARAAYVTLATPVVALTGLVLWSSTSVTPTSMAMAGMSVAAVRDGGVVMCVGGTALMAGHLGVALGRWRHDHRRERVPFGEYFAAAASS